MGFGVCSHLGRLREYLVLVRKPVLSPPFPPWLLALQDTPRWHPACLVPRRAGQHDGQPGAGVPRAGGQGGGQCPSKGSDAAAPLSTHSCQEWGFSSWHTFVTFATGFFSVLMEL